MALIAYQQQTQRLLNDVTQATFNIFDLTSYINTARSQIAGEGQCIRNYATLSLSAGVRQYAFTSVSLGSPSTGIQGILQIKQALINLGTGLSWMRPRGFPWFTLYRLNNVIPAQARPNEWTQFGQGVTGNIFVDPVPDVSYIMTLDTSCYPTNLATDADTETIPYPWTDAVPFFAAYYALLTVQRTDDAMKMFQTYETFMSRARSMSNPDLLQQNYAQSVDQTLPNKLAMRPAGGQQ